MNTPEKKSGITPLPQYVMPDTSEPPYLRILEEVPRFDHCLIGSSYYYIRAYRDRFDLCRIIYGGGSIFFHELVSCGEHGISDEDLEIAAHEDAEFEELPGFYPVSPLIEQKLRILYDR